MNLFATVLTYPAPSANYRGESELNRTVIQKITDGRFDYPIISPESMRNALREILASDRYKKDFKTLCNRRRVEPVAGDEKSQLAVEFEEFPDPDKFADDFLLGYLLAVKEKDLKKVREARGKGFPLKRDSVLRMNLAKALEPYRFNAVFTQSPKFTDDNPWKVGDSEKGTSSALLHRETAYTAFQYPFALNEEECKKQPDWVRALLKAIGELSDVAGNHARSYYEMAPASVVVRLTPQLVAGYQTYCFKPKGKTPEDELPDVILDILGGDFDDEIESGGKKTKRAAEFFIGGEIVKRLLTEKQREQLKAKSVTLDRDPRKLLETVADKFLGGK